jgi:hypothetical protein
MILSALYVVMAWGLFHIEIPEKSLLLIAGISLALRLSFITTNPIGSEDLYRYIWDGKVQAHGINPYLYTALDERLSFLHSQLLPAAMNHADLKTIYFPLSQWTFYACFQFSGEAVWGIKLVLLFAEVATMIGLYFLLNRLAIPKKFILLYSLCPLPIIQFAVDGHIDAVGLPLLIFSIYFLLKERKLLSLFLLGLSMSIKPVGLVLLPTFFLYEKGIGNKLKVVFIPLFIVVIQFLPYIFSSNPTETLFAFTKDWTFNGVVFESVNLYFNNNRPTRLLCAGLLGVAILLLNIKRKNLFDTLYFSVLLLMLFSPVVHPWYVTWVAVLLPIARRWSGIALAAGVSLTSFTIMNFRLTGIWEQYSIVLAVEYLPVLILLAVELRHHLSKRNGVLVR